MKIGNKIIDTIKGLHALKKSFYADNKIVLCRGHFNVIHPGHLRFLKHARQYGDKLIVFLLNDRLLHKEEFGDHFFHETERAIGVASLEYVDHVLLMNDFDINQVIKELSPLTFVLGKEFETDRISEVKDTIDLVKEKSGKVIFHSGDVTYSSKELFEKNVITIDNEKVKRFKHIFLSNNISKDMVENTIESFKEKKLLIIGDTIVDQFISCDAIGMSAEAPVIVLKELESREFIGGAAIVAAHAKALGAQCKYFSVVGNDSQALFVKNELEKNGIELCLFTDVGRPTTFKMRYMVENQKMFRVSRLNEYSISNELEKKIIKGLIKSIPDVNGIIISDFVYGLITPGILKALIDTAKKYKVKLFGDLQCSSQIGSVLKFENFDLITPTEREARIALSDHDSGLESIALNLIKKTSVKNLIITLGANGFIVYSKSGKKCVIASEHFPALCSNPVDVAGAGDSLLTSMSLSYCTCQNILLAAIIGSFTAAIAVSRVGNIPISAQEIKNYINKYL